MKYTSKQVALSAINFALISLSAQIYIPFSPPVTLQIAIIFFICGFFEFKISILSIFAYILAGIIGLPVFSGFQGGASVILGPTGGFIISFLFLPFIFLLFKANSLKKLIICYLVSLLVCYLLGFLWLSVYLKSSTAIKSILIFIPADILKMILSGILTIKLIKI